MSAPIAATTSAPAPPAGKASFARELGFDDFSFHDLLSIVNPLQHIPIVSTIYRAVTGDTIKPAERVAGDSLYGGLWGFASSVANVAYQEITGKDFGDTMLAFLEGGNERAQLASNATPSTGSANTSVKTSFPALQMAANGPPRQLQPNAGTNAGNNAAVLALMASMNAKGDDSVVSQRALAAYKRSLVASPALTSAPF